MFYSFHLPTRIIYGAGVISQAGAEAKQLGEKAMLVTYPNVMRQIGVLEPLLADLKANSVETVIFEKVEPNPRRKTVEEGSELAKKEKIDLIIGLGGGSAMDAAKAIAAGAVISDSIWTNLAKGIEAKEALPTIMIPTLAATGSEADHIAVVTDWDSHEKRVLKGFAIFPKVAILDPKLTLSLPANITAPGGVDIFIHATERYFVSATPFVLTTGILETVLRMVVSALPRVLAKLDDLEARSELLWASNVAMNQFGLLGGGAVGVMPMHGIGHALSGVLDIAHGNSLSAILLAWMRSIEPARKDRFISFGENIFGEADCIKATERWLDKVGMNLKLRDLGVRKEQFEEIAQNTIKTAPPGMLESNPVPVDKAYIVGILEESF